MRTDREIILQISNVFLISCYYPILALIIPLQRTPTYLLAFAFHNPKTHHAVISWLPCHPQALAALTAFCSAFKVCKHVHGFNRRSSHSSFTMSVSAYVFVARDEK